MADIKKCPKCGTPELDDGTKTLVLYFKTAQDRAEFVAAFQEANPNVVSVSVN